MSRIAAVRQHSFDAGHRVYGHESVCARVHGHGYKVELHCLSPQGLDSLGRVIDFGVIKRRVCSWIDDVLDHRFLAWAEDPFAAELEKLSPGSVVFMDENPTAENIGRLILGEANRLLEETGVVCVKVVVHETANCRAEVEL